MRTLVTIALATSLLICSCEKTENARPEDFCSVIPDGWECEWIREDIRPDLIPANAEIPMAVVRYENPSESFHAEGDQELNPSLILDLYPVQLKEELIQWIQTQEMYSWCIPIYYGETEDYFVMTSPCFINCGYFTDEANASIEELHSSLKSMLTVSNYHPAGE